MLFVQWFRLDSTFAGGFATKHLYRLEFVPADDACSDAFGFVDPKDVVRGIHLMPCFKQGHMHTLLGSSTIARSGADDAHFIGNPEEHDTDWCFYYVGM